MKKRKQTAKEREWDALVHGIYITIGEEHNAQLEQMKALPEKEQFEFFLRLAARHLMEENAKALMSMEPCDLPGSDTRTKNELFHKCSEYLKEEP